MRIQLPLGLCLSLCTVAIGGCTLVLDLDGLQGGEALDGSMDADADVSLADVTDFDAGRDAPDVAALDGGDLDGGTDVGLIDVGPIDGGPIDGGTDAGSIDAGRDAPSTVVVGGRVVGLPTGRTMRLGNGAAEIDVAGAAGSPTFSFTVPAGASYDVEIVTAPADLLCVLYRGSGTASAPVSNVFVGCSTAVDLVSFFPFDGAMAAARGSNWTSTAGSVSYVPDRVGRPMQALGVTTTANYRLLRPLDGRASVVAPHGTQFTVSAWVRIPASAPATATGVFSHAGPTALATELQINWRSGLAYAEHYFYWDGGFDRVLTSSTVTLSRDRWYHVTVAASGPSSASPFDFDRTIYVDGVRQATTTTCCGWGNDTHYWWLQGSTVERDDLRLYSRMLSDAEVAGIYAAEDVP